MVGGGGEADRMYEERWRFQGMLWNLAELTSDGVVEVGRGHCWT